MQAPSAGTGSVIARLRFPYSGPIADLIQICLSRCFGLLWRRCPTPAVAPLQTALRAGDEQRQGSPASLLPSPGGSLSSSRGELQTTKK
ncbi:hypothetical protein AV530_018201 [Patagioenas fasciata monilis]|uniref:Uncharacterized protein n=1 Tax=Patagioenas fasciata monilis TaxID=372326 RepID=A0A1V4KLB4_PATFA|nr:hypothetical protein AV530_018201 [Patagioenas fasciata monilis]